jgi:two-component system sensor histidine kinase ChvG
MQHDVRRLDRLISDISDASRLDAELSRHESQPLDAAQLARAVVASANDSSRGNGVAVAVTVEKPAGAAAGAFLVAGNESRLAQVLVNLIDNARSFSAPGETVRATVRRRARGDGEGGAPAWIDLTIEDEGPGISPQALERIFERFYTDRPAQNFGNNSGLGLSISRQIVEAHGGRMWAENIGQLPEPVEREDGSMRYASGARFVVALPALRP